MRSQVNPGKQPSLEDVRACIGKKKDKKQLTTPLELSQAIALEIYDIRIAIGATESNNQQPKNDGTVTCTFMCLKIPEKLQPVSDDKIANTFFLTFLLTFSQFFR